MKNYISILCLMLLPMFATGQRNERSNEREYQTIFGRNSVSHGGYGAFGGGYSMIDDKNGAVMSGRAAWIIGHGLGLGFSGTGFINDFSYDQATNENVNLTGGYGGFLVEPILFPKAPVHLAFPVVAGVGGIAYTRTPASGDPWDYNDPWIEDTETFLILEPGVELELNVLRFFRLAFGMSYRMTTDINLIDTRPDVLNGVAAGITFKFGKF